VKTQTTIPINRTNFLKLASALTHKDQKLRTRAVDYVTGFLVKDNFSTIQRLIDSFFLPAKKKIDEEIEQARRYLKYGFSDNLTNMLSHASTCLWFGLWEWHRCYEFLLEFQPSVSLYALFDINSIKLRTFQRVCFESR
jgi:hypothetical protein